MSVVDAGATTFKEPVLTITISKLEPECVNYSYHVEHKLAPGRPELLEAFVLVKNILEQVMEENEHAALNEYIKVSRDARRSLLQERLRKESESQPPPDVVH